MDLRVSNPLNVSENIDERAIIYYSYTLEPFKQTTVSSNVFNHLVQTWSPKPIARRTLRNERQLERKEALKNDPNVSGKKQLCSFINQLT